MPILKPKIGEAKQPRLKGVVMIDTAGGAVRVRRWPKKKSKKTIAKMQPHMDKFREAQMLAKYAPDVLQISAIEAVKGTPLYPRDIMTMAMYGRLFSIRNQFGKEIFSVATRNAVSDSLNVLGQTSGDILVRGEEFWGSVPIGEPGQVLTRVAGNPGVAWAAAPGGAGSYFAGPSGSSTNTSGRAGHGYSLRIAQSGLLFGLSAVWDAQIGNTLRGYVLRVDDNRQVLEVIAQTPDFVATQGGADNRYLKFNAPVSLEEGERYAFMIYNPTGSGTTSVRLRNVTNTFQVWPIIDGQPGLFDTGSPVPLVGSVLGSGAAGWIGVHASLG